MKRHEALVQLSRDHHFGLLLCWKIKEGLKREVEPEKIEKYIRIFYENNLKEHFSEEEQYVFGILGNEHPMIVEAVAQHRAIETMVETGMQNVESLTQFRNLLENHIRFEERQVFQEIQQHASEKQLQKLLEIGFHDLKEPVYEDEFWK